MRNARYSNTYAGARHRRRFGGATLEAALVVPFILLPLAFGTGEYGYYFFVKHTLQGAAREGCRAGIVLNNTNTNVTTAVAQYLRAAGLNSSTTTLDAKFTLKIESPQNTAANTATLAVGSPLYVTVQGSWGTLGQGFRPLGLIGTTNTVSGISVMRKEG